MAPRYIPVQRDQQFLMPPDVRSWLRPDHLAWFVVETVSNLDLSGFHAERRQDGFGRPSFDPAVMVGVLMYAYATGVRSSRAIERKLVEDVAFRVVAANLTPDHSTIARFRARFELPLSQLFTQVLHLCVTAELVDAKVVAIDGTKMAADASGRRNLDEAKLREIAEQIIADAARIDAEEDEIYGERGYERLPAHLTDPETRQAWIKEQLERLEHHDDDDGSPTPPKRINATDVDSRPMKTAKGFIQGYNAQAAATTTQIVVAADVTAEANDLRQLIPMVEQTAAELAAAGAAPAATVVADAGYLSSANLTADLGVELLVAPRGGKKLKSLDDDGAAERYEEQLRQVTIEHERRIDAFTRVQTGRLVVNGAATELGIGLSTAYKMWNRFKSGDLGALSPPLPRDPGPIARMRRRFAQQDVKDTYALRAQTIEPVFGQLKHDHGCDRFMRRGLGACISEWRLMMACHNVLKLHKATMERIRGSFSPRLLTLVGLQRQPP